MSRRVLSVLAVVLLATAAPAVLNPPAALSAPGYFPYQWATGSAEVGAYVSDGGGSGIDPHESYVTLDGTRLTTHYASGRLFATVNGMAEGVHTAAIHVQDRAGNALDFSWTFAVDVDAPTLTSKSPSGTIADSSPELRARIVDATSGIDPASISLGVRHDVGSAANTMFGSGDLAHRYDAATGEVSFQFPDLPRGAAMRDRPLVDGDYTVLLSFSDRAGHNTLWTWSFKVDSMAGVLPLR